MKWRIFFGLVSCLSMMAACDSDPQYDAQFITLPSGMKAYCNRQGYREVRVGRLVTDTGGNFVRCDAKIGPAWDANRTDENGNLLTDEQRTERNIAINAKLKIDSDKLRAARSADLQAQEERMLTEMQANIALREAEDAKEEAERLSAPNVVSREQVIFEQYQKAQAACMEPYEKLSRTFVPQTAEEVQRMTDLSNQRPVCNEKAQRRYSEEMERLRKERQGIK